MKRLVWIDDEKQRVAPIEPTDEMEVAAENHYESTGATFPDWKGEYRAMLAAAPTPPVSAQSEAKPVEFKYPDFTEWWYTQDVIDEDEPSARGLARRIFNDARAIDPRPSAPATHTHRFAIDPSSDEPRCVVCGCEPESVPAENGGDAEIKKLVERIKGGAELSEGGWSGTVKTCDAILEILSKRGGA